MVQFSPIGTLHTPFQDTGQTPIQPSSAKGAKGSATILPPFIKGLKDLEGFSHIILLYLFHQQRAVKLQVVPFLDTELRGVFATRAPTRPNPIGLSIVKLERVEEDKLVLLNVDMLDGTPLLDIKPYVPDFDSVKDSRIGWLEAARAQIPDKRSDQRFG